MTLADVREWLKTFDVVIVQSKHIGQHSDILPDERGWYAEYLIDVIIVLNKVLTCVLVVSQVVWTLADDGLSLFEQFLLFQRIKPDARSLDLWFQNYLDPITSTLQ